MMQILIISNPLAVKNEPELVNELFEEGLELFHLRKPNYTAVQMLELINKIKPEYHPRVALHGHYSLTEKFNIKRIHYPENKRLETTNAEFQNRKTEQFTLSTSIHSLNDQ